VPGNATPAHRTPIPYFMPPGYIRLLTTSKLQRRSVHICCLLIIFNAAIITSYSQQGNNWYFGRGAGLSFNSNPPSVLTDGQMFTSEGCSGISDNNGRILFYTDGVTVWNKLHQVMANGTGLKGNQSSSDAAIVIPRPGSGTIFYIFTSSAAEAGNEGYFFSEVDISLQGGLGEVTNKNIPLNTPSTEKLTAVRHGNGIDVWVLTKELKTDVWKTYKVDCNGVNTVPVISHAGRLPDSSFIDFNIGCLKASPDGTKIAAANIADQVWELLKFDPLTGVLSDGLAFHIDGLPFGVEFSPDSKLVYIGIQELDGQPNGGIFQYGLGLYDAAAIEATKTPIQSAHYIGNLQLGPDNKIYCANLFTTFLSVINVPDSPGLACSYSEDQVDMQGRDVLRGLPAFLPGLITHRNADFNYTIGPGCSTINFSGTTTITGNVSWQWDFGDGTTGTGQNVSHIYTSGREETDTVTLTVTPLGGCGFVEVSKKILFDFRKPLAKFGYEINCSSLEVNFHDSSASNVPFQNWYWNFGDGNSAALQDPVHTYAAPGNYTVKLSVQSANGCVSDTVSKTILFEGIPQASFTNSTVCMSDPVQFTNTSSAPFGNISNYAWDFGDGSTSVAVNPVHTYDHAGDFTVRLTAFTSAGCAATATRNFHIEAVKAFAGNDTIVSAGQPLQLHATGGRNYEWSPPDFLNANHIADPVAVLDKDQAYRVKVTTDDGCTGFDDIKIRVLKATEIYVPGAFAPDGKNRIFAPILIGTHELKFFSVYNRWGQLVFTTRKQGEGWDGKINGVAQPTGAYVWILELKDYLGQRIAKKGTVILIR
jgi:gliding motility-associated-like protein